MNLSARLCTEWRLKIFWAAVLTVWFYIPYPFLERHYLGAPFLIRPCIVDRAIPFQPGTAWIYLSLLLYVPFAPMLMQRRNDLNRYGLAMFGMTAVAYMIYFLSQTTWMRPVIPTELSLYHAVVAVDLPQNECPSLHAAYIVFSMMCLFRLGFERRGRAGSFAFVASWGTLILYSTMSTKQHAFLDIICGSILGLAAWSLAFRQRAESNRPF